MVRKHVVDGFSLESLDDRWGYIYWVVLTSRRFSQDPALHQLVDIALRRTCSCNSKPIACPRDCQRRVEKQLVYQLEQESRGTSGLQPVTTGLLEGEQALSTGDCVTRLLGDPTEKESDPRGPGTDLADAEHMIDITEQLLESRDCALDPTRQHGFSSQEWPDQQMGVGKHLSNSGPLAQSAIRLGEKLDGGSVEIEFWRQGIGYEGPVSLCGLDELSWCIGREVR